MAKKPAEEPAKGLSKTAIVEEALKEGIDKNLDIAAYAKEKHGVEITPQYVSIIKSNMKKKAGQTSGVIRKPRGKATESSNSKEEEAAELASSLAGLVQKHGADKCKATIDFLEKF